MALNNCTINSGSVSTTKDVAIGNLANIVLNIVPDDGYVVRAADFTNNSLQAINGIASISLSDKTSAYAFDNEVLVTVDLDNSFVPSSDVNMVIDIDGDAILNLKIPRTISGTYDTVLANCTTSNQTGVAYSNTNQVGVLVTVFTKTFTAISGKYFETPPSYSISTGLSDAYTITTQDTYTQNVYLTSRTFTVKATIPAVSTTGDNIDFTAQANGDIVAVSTGKIKAYRVNTQSLTYVKSVRQLAIYGDVGAQFTLGMVNEDNTAYNFIDNNFINGANINATIPATGSVTFDVVFPGVLDDDQYDFTLSTTAYSGSELSSAIDPNDDQVATFSIQQLGNIQYTVKTDAASDSRTYTSDPSSVHLGSPFFEFDGSNTVTSTLTLTDNADIVLSRLPIPDDFVGVNTDSTNSTDSSISIKSITANPSTLNASGNQSITFTVVSDVEFFGSTASSHTLDLGNFIAAESSGGGGFRIYTPEVTGSGGGLIIANVRASFNPGPTYISGLNSKSVAIGTPNDTNLYSGTGTLAGNFYGNSVSQITLSIAPKSATSAIDNLTITRGTLTGQAPSQNLYFSWTGQTAEDIDSSSDMTFIVHVSLANEP